MILYVVPTPIGNLGDITYRAIDTLKNSDVILCEDTRCSMKMLNYYEIKKKLVSYHKFNEYKVVDSIIENILKGVKYSLISDAGMPGISDPGKILINKCIEKGIKVDVLPGACALVNGVVLSGFNQNIFTFIGFLPKTTKELKESIELIKNTHTLHILYESPHRLLSTLDVLKRELGENKEIYVGRELTKLFEENFRGSIEEAIEYFNNQKIRGEFVLCLNNTKIEKTILSDENIIQMYYENEKKYKLTTKENIKKICSENNLKKNYVYDLIIKNIK